MRRPVGYERALALLTAPFRLSAALGLALTAQLVVLALLGAAFAGVTEDVVEGEEVVRLDDPVSELLVGQRRAWLTPAVRAVTELGSGYVLAGLLLAVGLLARRGTGTWRPLGVLCLPLLGAVLTSTAIKVLVERPRPPGDGALVTAFGYGFPSGHSTAAAAGWLAAALLVASLTRRRTLIIVVVTVAVVVVVLVGASRVYLGVHEPTDVLGGWVLGGIWVLAVPTTARLLRGTSRGPGPTPRGRVQAAPTAPHSTRTQHGPSSPRTDAA